MYPRRNKYSNKRALKSQRSSNHRTLCLVYIHVHLVSRSHFCNPKMADMTNVWDLPIKIFLTLEVQAWLQNLQKALRANNRSSLAKDETSGSFVATCSSVRKNNEKKKINLKIRWCCGPIPRQLYFAFL